MRVSIGNIIISLISGIYIFLAIFLFYSLSKIQLRESYTIEKELAAKDIQRILTSIDKLRDNVKAHHYEWSVWNEPYNYSKGTNKQFAKENINIENLTYVTDHFIFLNKNLEIINSGKLDLKQNTQVNLDKETEKILLSTIKLDEHNKKLINLTTGLIIINKIPYFFCTGPFKTVDDSEDPIGGLIFTKELSNEIFLDLSKESQLPISYAIAGTNKYLDFDKDTKHMNNESTNPEFKVFFEFDNENIKALAKINDYFNNPALIIETYAPEQIYNRSKRTLNTLLEYIIIFALITVVLTALTIRLYLIKPIKTVADELSKITTNKNSSLRLSKQKGKEFTIITDGVNHALESLNKVEQELITSRDSAIAANSAKSQFLASVSHELRTPIHGVLGLLRMMFKNEVSPSKLSLIQMSYNTTQGLLETINDLLDMSKAEAGKLSIEAKEFRLRHVIRDVLQAVGPRVHEKHHLELICMIDPEVPKMLWGDPNRIRQILMNLLGNAVKFTPKGVIELKVGVIEGKVIEANPGSEADRIPMMQVYFSCKDSGIGIPQEQLGKIFEAYEQADSSKAGKPQGTGLGLNVVKQLTETMGGKLEVRSEVGLGTEFIAVLPLGIPGAQTAAVIEDATIVSNSTNNHHNHSAEPPDLIEPVFCISDKEAFTEMVRKTVSAHKVDVRQSRRENLCRFNTDDEFVGNTFVVDGKLLREESFWVELKEAISKYKKEVIIIATPSELTHRDRLELMGVHAILLRPFIPDDLVDTLAGKRRGTEIVLAETEMTANTKIKGLERLHVLVADDTKTNQIILANMLEDAGHSVTIAADGQEMMDIIEAGSRLDLILTDVQMPRIDGLQATQMIREREERLKGEGRMSAESRLPIIAVTAHAFSDEHKKMMQAGVDAVITKPIDPSKLRKLMQEMFADRIKDREVERKLQQSEIATAEIDNTDEKEKNESSVNVFETKSSLIDIENLKQRANGKESLVKMIVGSFLEMKGDLLNEIDEALEAGDMKNLSSRAHALKGTLLDVGARDVADIAAWIEKNAQKETKDIIGRVVDTLHVKANEVEKDALKYI